MANLQTQKRLSNNISCKKKQSAARSLNIYIDQLKIHFDLNEKDTIKVLEQALKERRKENIIKKLWRILK